MNSSIEATCSKAKDSLYSVVTYHRKYFRITLKLSQQSLHHVRSMFEGIAESWSTNLYTNNSIINPYFACLLCSAMTSKNSYNSVVTCTCPSHAMVCTLIIHQKSTVTLSCASLLQPSSLTRTLVQSISPVSAAVISGVQPFWNQMYNEHRTGALQLTAKPVRHSPVYSACSWDYERQEHRVNT